MSIKILNASISSSLQDFGRRGYADIGIARGGAMDELVLRIGNILLGNDEDEAGLEIFLHGGSYEFLDSHYFVLSGADFGATLNGKSVENYKVCLAKKGDILALGFAKTGVCGYLCVRGGFKVKKFLGSKSSDFKMQVGIFEGRFLKNGDILECENLEIGARELNFLGGVLERGLETEMVGYRAFTETGWVSGVGREKINKNSESKTQKINNLESSETSKSKNLNSKNSQFDSQMPTHHHILKITHAPPQDLTLNPTEIPIIRVILGPDDDAFTQKGIETFLSATYKVGAKSSRMAIMCESAEKIEHRAGADIISSPITFGSVQVPKSGEPLVLAAWRQTTGGYARIACVIESDLHILVQIKIGGSFRFQQISMREAIEIFNERERRIENFKNHLGELRGLGCDFIKENSNTESSFLESKNKDSNNFKNLDSNSL